MNDDSCFPPVLLLRLLPMLPFSQILVSGLYASDESALSHNEHVRPSPVIPHETVRMVSRRFILYFQLDTERFISQSCRHNKIIDNFGIRPCREISLPSAVFSSASLMARNPTTLITSSSLIQKMPDQSGHCSHVSFRQPPSHFKHRTLCALLMNDAAYENAVGHNTDVWEYDLVERNIKLLFGGCLLGSKDLHCSRLVLTTGCYVDSSAQ